jgi:protein-tyrosine-phosphatase
MANHNDLIFVCTGNTCRSPMAEYLTRAMADERGYDIAASSRGLAVAKSKKVSRASVDAVRQLYPESAIRRHKSKPFGVDDFMHILGEESLVLTMTESHRDSILKQAKEGDLDLTRNVYALREYTENWGIDERGWVPMRLDVEDPFGGYVSGWDHFLSYLGKELPNRRYESYADKLEEYVRVRDQIAGCLTALLDNAENLPSHDAIMERRRRIPLQQEILSYERLASRLLGDKVEAGSTVEISPGMFAVINGFAGRSNESVFDPTAYPFAFADTGSDAKVYLAPALAEIQRVVDEKGLTLAERKPKQVLAVADRLDLDAALAALKRGNKRGMSNFN